MNAKVMIAMTALVMMMGMVPGAEGSCAGVVSVAAPPSGSYVAPSRPASSPDLQIGSSNYASIPTFLLPTTHHHIEDTLPQDASIVLHCPICGLGCAFYVNVYHCPFCSSSSNGGLEVTLREKGFEPRTRCSPSFSECSYDNHPTMLWKMDFASGQTLIIPMTKEARRISVFSIETPNEQQWCGILPGPGPMPVPVCQQHCCNEGCETEFQEIFYRRYTPFPNRKFLNIIVQGPFSGETFLPNVCGVDFDLYSTYADAIAKTNKWQHCHTSDTKGLPGYSGPVGHSDGQETCGSGCQPDYAYYVEEGNWIPIVGAIEFHIDGYRDGQIIERANTNNFNSILANSGNSIIRRICVDCVAPYDDVYYRRYTSPPDDLYAILYHSFDHNMVGNKMGTDFNLFSTFEDAVRDINPWEYCVTYDPLNKAGFPNRCGPDYESTRMDQWHLYNARGNNVAGTAVQRTLIVIQNDGTDQVKFKQEWMTENEEMMAFLYPDEYGPVDDVGVRQCQEPGSYGTDDPALDVADTYNGWYDVTRCGKCNDYCRWVPLETKKARSNCPDVSGRSLPDPFAGGLPTDIVDEYAGWYDVSNCGSCNYYCRWVTSYPGLPGGGNPVFRTSYGAFVWWDCAPAGTQYNTMTWMPEALGYYYWGFSFNHNKCDQQGPIRATEVTEGIDPHISTVGESVHFSCIMSGSVGGTEPGHFDEFDHQKCSSEGADTPVTQRAEKFLGCFGDKSNRALPYRVGDGISYELCESTCRAKGYHYFGLQWQRECWCGALSASDDTYKRYGQMDAAACNYCMGNYFGDWRNCVWQVQDQFDPKVEWKKHECSHIPIQDTRKQCYISCRDKNDDVTNMLVCAKLKRAGMEWLAKEITQWLDSPVCANKDCSTNVHPLGKDIGNGKGTF